MRKISEKVLDTFFNVYANRADYDKGYRLILSRTSMGIPRDIIQVDEGEVCYFLFKSKIAWIDAKGELWVDPLDQRPTTKERMNAFLREKCYVKKGTLYFKDRPWDEPYNVSQKMFQSDIDREKAEKEKAEKERAKRTQQVLKETQEAYMGPLYSS